MQTSQKNRVFNFALPAACVRKVAASRKILDLEVSSHRLSTGLLPEKGFAAASTPRKIPRRRDGKVPALIFYAVTLSDGKQTENRAGRPARPISRGRGAFVGPGVSFDEGVILEAGAIVLNDVNPWRIVLENTTRD